MPAPTEPANTPDHDEPHKHGTRPGEAWTAGPDGEPVPVTVDPVTGGYVLAVTDQAGFAVPEPDPESAAAAGPAYVRLTGELPPVPAWQQLGPNPAVPADPDPVTATTIPSAVGLRALTTANWHDQGWDLIVGTDTGTVVGRVEWDTRMGGRPVYQLTLGTGDNVDCLQCDSSAQLVTALAAFGYYPTRTSLRDIVNGPRDDQQDDEKPGKQPVETFGPFEAVAVPETSALRRDPVDVRCGQADSHFDHEGYAERFVDGESRGYVPAYCDGKGVAQRLEETLRRAGFHVQVTGSHPVAEVPGGVAGRTFTVRQMQPIITDNHRDNGYDLVTGHSVRSLNGVKVGRIWWEDEPDEPCYVLQLVAPGEDQPHEYFPENVEAVVRELALRGYALYGTSEQEIAALIPEVDHSADERAQRIVDGTEPLPSQSALPDTVLSAIDDALQHFGPTDDPTIDDQEQQR